MAGCYGCGSVEGNEVTLCPRCMTKRKIASQRNIVVKTRFFPGFFSWLLRVGVAGGFIFLAFKTKGFKSAREYLADFVQQRQSHLQIISGDGPKKGKEARPKGWQPGDGRPIGK